MPSKQTCRTLFVSDIHLGLNVSNAQRFLNFLEHIAPEKIYIVGDLLDLPALHGTLDNLNPIHRKVWDYLIEMAHNGVKINYITGNNDDSAAELGVIQKLGWPVSHQTIFTSSCGEKFLLIHGNEIYESLCKRKSLHSFVMGLGYYTVMVLNKPIQTLTSWCAHPWNLSEFLKKHIKSVRSLIQKYQFAMSQAAANVGANGVICGHIHTPDDVMVNSIRYLNCGCWTEGASAIIENMDGNLELIFHS